MKLILGDSLHALPNSSILMNPTDVLSQIGVLGPENQEQFLSDQVSAAGSFRPNEAHNADVVLNTDASGLYFVEKVFGKKRAIPSHVAEGLTADIVAHEKDLGLAGVNYAKSYGVTATPSKGGQGLVHCCQLFFPHGTLEDYIKGEEDTDSLRETLARSVDQLLIPVLSASTTKSDDSPVWLDLAPKNIGLTSDRSVLIDTFYPRIRKVDGTVKTYPDFTFHKRPEEEMVRRFFTGSGIVTNFIRKTNTIREAAGEIVREEILRHETVAGRYEEIIENA